MYMFTHTRATVSKSWKNNLHWELSWQHQQPCPVFHRFSSGASEWKDESPCCTA